MGGSAAQTLPGIHTLSLTIFHERETKLVVAGIERTVGFDRFIVAITRHLNNNW